MSNSQFSEEDGSSQENPSQYSEFVLIDNRNEQNQYTYFGSDLIPQPLSTENEEPKSKNSGSISPRYLCFLGLIFCLIFGVGVLIGSVAFTCLAALSLFKNSQLNEGMKSFWGISWHTLVAGLCFTLGLISPTLGISLIVFYFSIKGNLMNDEILQTVIRSSFGRI